MKSINKILLTIIFASCISWASAQEPNFTVNWTSYCELQSQDSHYIVEWALIYLPTQEIVRQGTSDNIPLTVSTYYKELTNWDCDKDEVALNYMWVVAVKRYQTNGLVSCSGEARSSQLRCSDLYDGVTLTVNMTYP
jgi:hypothetical protein